MWVILVFLPPGVKNRNVLYSTVINTSIFYKNYNVLNPLGSKAVLKKCTGFSELIFLDYLLFNLFNALTLVQLIHCLQCTLSSLPRSKKSWNDRKIFLGVSTMKLIRVAVEIVWREN